MQMVMMEIHVRGELDRFLTHCSSSQGFAGDLCLCMCVLVYSSGLLG